jgi:hypothetical protein
MIEESTYLEDYLQSLEHLPNDIRRDFELMREHDKECCENLRILSSNEQKFLQELKRQRLENRKLDTVLSSELNEINALYDRISSRSMQKSSLAANILRDLEKFVHKLDKDLVLFESDLRGCGEFEQITKGIESGSEVNQVFIRINQLIYSNLFFNRLLLNYQQAMDLRSY